MNNVIIKALNAQVKSGKKVTVKLVGFSMTPTIHNGDFVDIEPYDFENVKENDIIAFSYAEADHFIIHRVIKIEERKGNRYFFTKGDNNQYIDARAVQKKDFVGMAKAIKGQDNIAKK